MALALQQDVKRYTAEEFFALPDDGIQREVFDGIIHIKVESLDHTRPLGMAGALFTHQALVGEIFGQLRDFLKGKKCRVFTSPADIQLSLDDESLTVVQPDIFVICDKSKIEGRVYKGAPTLAIEILSPTTAKNDKIIKMNKYRQAGVREYWIVDPVTQFADVHLLFDDKYSIRTYSNEDTAVPVMVLEGCTINLTEVFAAVDELNA